MKTLSRKLNTTKALLALFAAFLTCTGQAGEFVICLGDDGHFAIETVVNGQCECDRHAHTPESSFVSIQDEVVFSSHHEHDHFDIPIFMNDIGNFIIQGKYFVIHNQIFSLFDTTFIYPYFNEIIQEVLIIEPPPDINPALVSIRTVISLS